MYQCEKVFLIIFHLPNLDGLHKYKSRTIIPSSSGMALFLDTLESKLFFHPHHQWPDAFHLHICDAVACGVAHQAQGEQYQSNCEDQRQ